MKILITIPVKNGVKILGKTLESIRRQTYETKNITTMVVDNCSEDEVEFFLRRHYPWVRYVKGATDIGRIPNWNRCLDIFRRSTQYDLMKFVFAGDSLKPDCLEKQVELISPQVQFVTCSHVVGDEAGNVSHQMVHYAQNQEMLLPQETIQKSIVDGNWFAGCAANPLFSRRVLSSHKFPENMSWAGDWMFWANLARKNAIGYIAKPLTYFNTGARAHYALLGTDPKSNKEEELVKSTMRKF